MTPLFAQEANPSYWPMLIEALSDNGFWVFVAVCVLAGTAKNITAMVLRHRERVAMIENGLDPTAESGDKPHQAA